MPSSEIQVKSSRCWRPLRPESKSTIRATESPRVASANSTEIAPARRSPYSPRPASAAIRPPASGRKTSTESISGLSLATDHQEVEAEATGAGKQQQRVVAEDARLGDPHDRAPGPHRQLCAADHSLDHEALEH